MVDIFLGPVMVEIASVEVGRCPRYGETRTKMNNGRGPRRDGKLCLCGRGSGGGRPWRGVGGRGEARAQLGAPARAAWGVRPPWVLLGGGGGNTSLSSASTSITLESTYTFYLPRTGLPGTCLSSPDPAGPTGAAFISHPSFCSARGNSKTAMVRLAKLLGTRNGGRGLSRRWQLRPGCTWRRSRGGGGSGQPGGALARFSAPLPAQAQ